MHLLIRRISPYTGKDLLLGVYRTFDEAKEYRREYLRTVLHGRSDPWKGQAYHRVSDDDVRILSSVRHLNVDDASRRVLVVSSCSEGFGQIVRRFEAIADSVATARAYAAKLEARDDGQFPFYCEVDEVVVGEPTW
jgi:hypothetical protein